MMVSTAPSSTAFDHVVLESDYTYLTIGSKAQLTGKAVSATGNAVEMPDGSAVRISKFEYLTPDKKSMTDLGGVMPNVPSYQIEDSDMDVQLEAAKDVLE